MPYSACKKNPLPADAGTSWTIDSQDGTACSISAGTMTCAVGTMLAGGTYTAHLSSPTNKFTHADPPSFPTRRSSDLNDGTADASDSVTVLGTQIALSKSADTSTVSA